MLDLQSHQLGAPERTDIANEDERMVAATPQRREATSITSRLALITLWQPTSPLSRETFLVGRPWHRGFGAGSMT